MDLDLATILRLAKTLDAANWIVSVFVCCGVVAMGWRTTKTGWYIACRGWKVCEIVAGKARKLLTPKQSEMAADWIEAINKPDTKLDKGSTRLIGKRFEIEFPHYYPQDRQWIGASVRLIIDTGNNKQLPTYEDVTSRFTPHELQQIVKSATQRKEQLQEVDKVVTRSLIRDHISGDDLVGS